MSSKRKFWLLALWRSLATLGIRGQCNINGENLKKMCIGQITRALHAKSITKPGHINIMEVLLFALRESDIILHQLHRIGKCQTYMQKHDVDIY